MVRPRQDPGIAELERRIGVRRGFVRRLLREDDWSFVIKFHALFEAVCTHLLLHHFKEPNLAELFSRLELSNKMTGKIVFLGKLELLNADNRRFISTLSELRNSLVHDVRNSEFSLDAYIAAATSDQVKSWAIAYSPSETFTRRFPYDPKMKLGFGPEDQLYAAIDKVVERFRDDPKRHIWVGGYNVLVSLVDMDGYSDYKQWVKAKAHE